MNADFIVTCYAVPCLICETNYVEIISSNFRLAIKDCITMLFFIIFIKYNRYKTEIN